MHGSPSFRLWAGIVIAFAGHGAFAATTLTMTTEYPATSMPGQGVSTFADLVRSKSAGQVVIDASFDAAKGIKSGDMIDAVETRKVDAGDAFAGALAAKYPLFGVSSLPFLADSLSKARAQQIGPPRLRETAGRARPEAALHHPLAGLGHLVQGQGGQCRRPEGLEHPHL